MKHLAASQTRVPGRLGYSAAVAALAIAAAGCGSSSKVVSGTGSAGGSAAASAGSAPGGSASPKAPSPTAGVRTVALPAPCTLLTPADAAPLFGTTELSMGAVPRTAAGVAQCSFNLKVGIQAKQVSIVTRQDFANDQSYIFPKDGTTPVNGLGYPAVVRSTDNHSSSSANRSSLTMKLGKNVLEIDVEWYTDPVNNAFLTTLAKAALARV